MEFAAARERLKREHQRDLTLAWSMAALTRTKQLPSLQKLLGTPTRVQSPQEQRLALAMIFGHGGKPS